MREGDFRVDLTAGFERLFAAADSGSWYFPLYTEQECAGDEVKRGAHLVWFPSDDGKAAERPYVLLVPGGGFINVWNLTEGWPVAAQFNRLGYNVFILTYRVEAARGLLDLEMDDMARAIELIRGRAAQFGVAWDRYYTCGFSAGGYLVCLWNVPEKGYAAHGLPAPRAVFPVYPLTSWKLVLEDDDDGEDDEEYDPDNDLRLFGCTIEEAAESPFEIVDHVQGFPPCALFLAAEDKLVPPEHSRRLADALAKAGIPCRLEIGPTGGHGFADGRGTCMEGWIGRAVDWAAAQKP